MDDITLLTKTRLVVLRAANRLPEDADLSLVGVQSEHYYRKAIMNGNHTAWLALEGETVVGTGGVSYFNILPTCHIPSGRKAYIMNMYTDPAWRRQGIALHILDLLVKDAYAQGIEHISLEATEAGRPLYEYYGFVPMNSEMELPNCPRMRESAD